MDYFRLFYNFNFTNVLRLIVLYVASLSTGVRKLSDLIKTILICVPKMSEGFTVVKRLAGDRFFPYVTL